MNISAVDLNLLVAFDALVAERNVTRAAERVGLSQPAMSNALSRLRRLFEDPLMVRKQRTVVPTARARRLARPIHEAGRRYDRQRRARRQRRFRSETRRSSSRQPRTTSSPS